MAPTPLTWNGTYPDGTPFRWGDRGLVWNGNVPEPQPYKHMTHLRVLLGFTNAPDHSLEETGGRVLAQLFDIPAYANPPVTKVALQAAVTDFTNAIAAQPDGGKAATADKNNKRAILVTLLRKLAGHVQEHCGDDLALLLSSGFEAVSGHSPSTPLPKPADVRVENGNSGQLKIRVKAIANARCYEVRYAVIAAGGTLGPWQMGGLFTSSRDILLDGLTPGTNYSIQVRAVGGSTRKSDWSDPISHMSL
ncbi:MAG: fibronectin type III domain-containing protein [Verrucomicrobiota bacterium]